MREHHWSLVSKVMIFSNNHWKATSMSIKQPTVSRQIFLEPKDSRPTCPKNYDSRPLQKVKVKFFSRALLQ